jgi:hypothetical protein
MKLTKAKLHTAVYMAAAALFIAFVGTLSSCSSSDATKPAPTVTVDQTALSNVPGQQVSAVVTISAPEGAKTLSILKNGASDAGFPDQSISGTSATYNFEYTIPLAESIGTVTNFSFQATDNKGQKSQAVLVKVTSTAKQIVEVTADIITNTTWTADKIYRLNGFIRVGSDVKPAPGGAGVAPVIDPAKKATLTIEAGTTILGKKGTPGGALIIQRGSKLIAIGTVDKPIVFTSDQAPGNRVPGDWAGVVLCGQSANNIKGSTSTGQDGVEELEGGYGAYYGGGASPILDDNSGTLKYVRIEYAGYPINPNQEVNGLTFGSVGSGTTIDYVQVTYANDDSFEWFGGTVNATHLIALKGIDDDFDTDNGFSGKVQFGLGIRAAAIADQSGSNGFECDNDANGSSNTPFTTAEFSNMTIIGGKKAASTTIDIQFQNGAQIRRNAKQKIYNSIITAYPNGLYIDNALGNPGAVANATNGDIAFKNNILAGVEKWGGNGFGSASTADERNAVTGSTTGNASYPFLNSSNADANHPNNPRGRVVAAGVGAFSNGAFAYTTGELQISSLAAPLWFVGSSLNGADGNTLLAKWTDSGLSENIFDPVSAPTLLPTASSPLLSGASFTGLTGFTSTTYRGAFGATDWTSGWANWNPQITDYSK